MIKFENTEVMGWEHAIRGCRNPMNSWDRSDSGRCEDFQCELLDGTSGYLSDNRPICPLKNAYECGLTGDYIIGPNDLDLMKRLAAGGPVHAKYRRMITVYVDITAPLYWWKEFDTYKVGTVANSCSTMHKIADKEFTLEDFSTEHFITADNDDSMDAYIVGNTRWGSNDVMNITLKVLNYYRNRYLKTKDKKYWWQMIQLLPSSYNQKRTVMCNYETLTNIYKSRKDHKLDEWKTFCNDWIKNLPYSDLITGEDENEKR